MSGTLDHGTGTGRSGPQPAAVAAHTGGSDTEVVLRTDGLVKDYGTVRALDGLDLEVRRGEVFGFLGPNGAGKSTTIRVLLDQLRPTSGRAELFGVTPQQGGAPLRARLGYLPGELTMSGRASAGELLEHLVRVRGGVGRDRIRPLAERLTLDLDKPIRGLSKGNKQKVGIVQAFVHAPELLILDEPTSGLDPLLQHEFLTMTREAQAEGATVFMSSHVLSEVELVAGRVAIVRQGRIVDLDDVATLRHHAGQQVELTFAGRVDAAAFHGLPGVEDVEVVPGSGTSGTTGDRSLAGSPSGVPDGASPATTLTCLLRGEPDALLKAAAAHHVVRWSAQDRELEDLFLDFYRIPVEGDPEVATDGR